MAPIQPFGIDRHSYESIATLAEGGEASNTSNGIKKLGVLPLSVLVFYSVSGGPFGVESAVRSGGNFYCLLGFLAMPIVWSLPEAWITAELGTAFPEAAGGVAWVEEAFGEKAGFMSG